MKFENSPAIYGWVRCQTNQTSPVRDERKWSAVPAGLGILIALFPAINGWAVFSRGIFSSAAFRSAVAAAVHAAQKLNRQWIGIDITHLAISLIEKRLKDAFSVAAVAAVAAVCDRRGKGKEDSAVTDRRYNLQYEIHGTPKDLDAARDLATRDKYPRAQLLTIEGLLNHTQRAEHPGHAPDLNFKKARAESNAAQKSLI